MLQQQLTYIDLNGTERTENFYFHLSEREAFLLAARFGGDIEAYVNNLAESQDLDMMLEFFEKILLDSYGKKAPDGRTFEKNAKIRSEFENSVAYSELFMKMLTDHEFGVRFAEGIAKGAKGDKSIPDSEKNQNESSQLEILGSNGYEDRPE